MGRAAWSIAGGIVGAFFGAPQIGAMVGGAIGSVVDPEVIQGPRIGEVPAQTSAEGAPRTIAYGTTPCVGNVIACGPLIKADVEEEGEGKGGPVTTREHCYRTFAIRICEGPIGGVLRIWEDEKLVYDVRVGSLILAESAKWLFGSGIHLGTEDQLPDTFLELNINPDMPAYRGTAYMTRVFVDLTDRRGSIPQYRFEVTQNSRLATGCIASRGDFGTILSPDGTNWANSAAGSGLPYLIATGTRYIGWAISNTHPSYSDDEGASWQAATGVTMGATGGTRVGWAIGDVVLIPNGAGLVRSVDAGLSYLNVSGAPVCRAAFGIGDTERWGIFDSAGNIRYSDDDGTTWTTGVANTLGTSYAVYRAVGVTETLLAGASPFPHVPRIISLNIDPDTPGAPPTIAEESLPTLTGEDHFLAIACGTVGPNMVYVAACSGGKVVAKLEGVWEFVDTFPVTPRGIAFNGSVFVIVGSTGTHGVIKISADGETWTTAVDSTSLVGGEVWNEVACIPPQGYIGASQPLQDIVADIIARCSLPLGKYDVSELTDEVAGLGLSGDYTGASAIDALRSVYFFDKSEHDKKIYFPKRGAAVATTLTIDDLVEEPDSSKRQQASEYPRKLHLFYQHANSGYARVKATSARSSPDIRVTGELSVESPVVLNEDQAAQTAAKMHKVAWAEADGEVELSVPESFLRLIPSDCIGLSLRGKVSRLRIDSAEHAEGIIKWKLRYDRQSAYTSNLTGVPIPPPTLPPPTIVGGTAFAILDIGSRVDNEDDLHYLVAGSGGMPAWYGWTLQRSLDGGANYSNVQSFNSAAIMGSLVDDVATASEYYTDTTNVVRVQLIRDTQVIEDITEAQFLSEGGGFALEKADGSYEVMQYRDAVDEGDGVFALSVLHRGQLNSGPSAHLAGAMFVMLNRAAHIPAQSSWIGQDLTHRPVSFDQSPEEATAQTDTYVGRSQLEWPVAYLTLARDGSDVITGTWTPRHRFGSDDAPIASINFQGYRVTLDDGVLPAVTFDTTLASFSYDASALGAPLDVSVSALNRITGAGPATSGTV